MEANLDKPTQKTYQSILYGISTYIWLMFIVNVVKWNYYNFMDPMGTRASSTLPSTFMEIEGGVPQNQKKVYIVSKMVVFSTFEEQAYTALYGPFIPFAQLLYWFLLVKMRWSPCHHSMIGDYQENVSFPSRFSIIP